MPFYSVASGRQTGIFKTWGECETQVKGFTSAAFKKFATQAEAEKFIAAYRDRVVDRRKDTNIDSSNGIKKRKSKTEQGSSSKKIKLVEARDKNFTVDDDGYLVIYTDGCCFFNGRNGSRAGIGVYFGENCTSNVSEPAIGRATNNTAEIQAAICALEVAKKSKFDKVLINTDSNFMINAVTKWMKSWKGRNWLKADGKEVINKDDFKKLDKLTEGIVVKWKHIKAHDGVEGNEAADLLAKEGAKRYIIPQDIS